MKYKQGYPDRFGSIQDARAHCDKFFNWYNYEHKHSGIAYMTPDQMHNGLGDIIYKKRKETLYQAIWICRKIQQGASSTETSEGCLD